MRFVPRETLLHTHYTYIKWLSHTCIQVFQAFEKYKHTGTFK
jgi:hypothetical protein